MNQSQKDAAKQFFGVVARASPGDNETISLEDIRATVHVDLNRDGKDNKDEKMYVRAETSKSRHTGRDVTTYSYKSETQYLEMCSAEKVNWDVSEMTESSIVQSNLQQWSAFYEAAMQEGSLAGKQITESEFCKLLDEFSGSLDEKKTVDPQ